MQNIGTLDNQYNILSYKERGFNRMYYTARNNQNENFNLIGIETGENNLNEEILNGTVNIADIAREYKISEEEVLDIARHHRF